MARNRGYTSVRNNRKAAHLPPVQGFAQRVAALRSMLDDDPADAGDQALKLLEEYLESLALLNGFQSEAGLGRYVSFLRGIDALSEETLDQADAYTQVRNCLAHTYGLQVSPALAAEVVDFIGRLLRRGGTTAATLLTADVRVVQADTPLTKARDLMLREGYGRLPVLRDGTIIGLLIERDLVAIQALVGAAQRPFDTLLVADALPADSAERVAVCSPGAARAEVIELLRQPGVVVCLVTPSAVIDQRPVGIITHADLLYRM